MLCKYRFKVHGRVRLESKFPIPSGGASYDFDLNEHGVITHIVATVAMPDERHWPKVVQNPQPGVKLGLHIPSTAHLPFVQIELRSVEGLLSLYGLEGIDIDTPALTWEPENEEERQRIKLFSFERSSKEIDDAELYPVSFDLVARSILSAWDAREINVPLSFFRKGRIDIRERRYIEAYYDFFFVLETTFGEGKFKTAPLKQAFKTNNKLLGIVTAVLSDAHFLREISRNERLQQKHTSCYAGKPAVQILDALIDLRGLLHHHSSKDKHRWHPEDHQKFELEAKLIERVAFGVVFDLSEPFIFNQARIDTFLRLAQEATNKH